MESRAMLLWTYAVACMASTGALAGPVGDVNQDGPTLVQVHVVFRHGARTPTAPYPTDPHKDERYMPYGLGHLTAWGRQLEYELGQVIRSRYVGHGATVAPLLDPNYYQGEVKINTSAVQRTQESVSAMMASLFPPSSASQIWRTGGLDDLGALWMPIPYNILPLHEDRAIAGSAPCASRDLEQQRVYDGAEYKSRVLRAVGGQAFLDYVERHAGVDYGSDPGSLYLVYATIKCQLDLNMSVPEWSSQVYPEPLRTASNLWLMSLSYTPKLRRQSFGDLTTWILQNSRNYADEPKLQVYSGHDSTVAALLQIFHLDPQQEEGRGIPDYGACVFVEVYETGDGELALKFLYRREHDGAVVTMVPRGCAELCPLDKLVTLIADELPRADETCDVPDLLGPTRNLLRAHVQGDLSRGRS